MSALLDWLVVPLSYPFMQRALIVAVLVGAVCAVLSCYLVLKGWSLMGDAVSLGVLLLKWKDLMIVFFDEAYARSIGLNTTLLKALFFTLLSACTVAALQTVGACLVIAMVVTPGATAYLLTDRFGRLIAMSVAVNYFQSSFLVAETVFLKRNKKTFACLCECFVF